MSEAVKFILTIDTEEDNWGNYSCRTPSLNNLSKFPNFHDRCQEYGVRPTYLITYPVATDTETGSMFRSFAESGTCEIGAHCHPWNTPPVEETPSTPNSMLANLPERLQLAKLRTLTEAIQESIGVRPTSFRAGRWGISGSVCHTLGDLGYLVDTSVIPLQNWGHLSGADFSGISSAAFWRTTEEILPGCTRLAVAGRPTPVEIPISVGFLQDNHKLAESLYRIAARPALRKLRTIGVLDRLSLATKVALLPEIYSLEDMIDLSERLIRRGVPYLNFSFHSCAMTEGLTPFHKTKSDIDVFERKIFGFFQYLRDRNVRCVTLSEAAEEVMGRQPQSEKSREAINEIASESGLLSLPPVSPFRDVA